jgi:hypothetical protein
MAVGYQPKENSAEFEEELAAVSAADQAELERMELERMYGLEETREDDRQSLRRQATDAAKQVAKDYAKKEVKALASTAVKRGAASLVYYLSGTAGAVILGLILIIGIIVIVIASMDYACNSGRFASVVKVASKVSAWVGFTDQDFCAEYAKYGGGAGSPTADPLPDVPPVNPNPPALGGTDAAARAMLAEAGVGVNKLCSDPTVNLSQTCLNGTTISMLTEIINLARACDGGGPTSSTNNCNVLVTGGSELGHASGTCSHRSGNKIDIRDNPDITNYLLAKNASGNYINVTYLGIRGDGAQMYRLNASGVTYARETSPPHWDIGC